MLKKSGLIVNLLRVKFHSLQLDSTSKILENTKEETRSITISFISLLYSFFTGGVFISHRGSIIKFETTFNSLIAFRKLLKDSFADSCIRYRRISSNYFPTWVLVENPKSFATYVQAEAARREREKERYEA